MLVAHAYDQLVICVQHRDAAWLETFDQLGLRRRDVFDGPQILEVHWRDHQLHCDVRRCDFAEPLNFVRR